MLLKKHSSSPFIPIQMRTICGLVFLALTQNVLALDVGPRTQLSTLPFAYGQSYQDNKSELSRRSFLPQTSREKLDDLHSILKTKIGERGFKNFFGSGLKLPVDTPGLKKTVLLASSDNKHSARGYRRSLVYAEKLHQGGRFKVDALNSIFKERQGQKLVLGDHDLLLTSKKTGRQFSVEVKDRSTSSMKKGISKLKAQAEKEIAIAKSKGQTYLFISREDIPFALKKHIAQNGGLFMENVRSQDFSDKLTKLDPPHLKQRVVVAGGIGLSVLGGIGGGFEMWNSGVSMSNDFMDLSSNRKPSLVAYASLANNSTRFAAGAVSVAESATVGLLMAGVGSSSTVMTQVIPGVGLVVMPVVLSANFLNALTQSSHGYMSDAEFRRVALRSGVEATAALSGAGIGFMFGGPFGAGIGAGIGYGIASLGFFTADSLQTNSPKVGMFAIMTDAERSLYVDELSLSYKTR
jgi:hypothetical protein